MRRTRARGDMKVVPKRPSINKQAVRRSFDRAAAEYDAHSALQQRIACDLIEVCDRLSPRPEHRPRAILDAGAGTGYGVRLLRSRFPRALIVGLDFAPQMVRRAARGCDSASHFVCADAERPPFGDGVFDLVYSSSLVQWCDEPGGLFGQFRRLMRGGGWLLFSTYGPKTLHELRQSWAAADRYGHTLEFPGGADLKKMLRARGFDVKLFTRQLEVVHHRGVGELLQQLKSSGATNRHTAARRGLTTPAALRAMKQYYQRRFGVRGLVAASYEILVFAARAAERE